jgi:hypothetical protein
MLNAIRFAAFLALMVAAVTVNTMVNGPRPTEAAPVEMAALPDCEKCETSMASLQQPDRWRAGVYIGDKPMKTAAAVKAKPTKAKLHHKAKHHPKAKKPLGHSTRHRRATHHRAPHGLISAPTSHHEAQTVKGQTMKLDVHSGRAPMKIYAGQRGKPSKYTPLERVKIRDKARAHREAIRKVAERAEPTVIPYSVRNAISQAQERAVVSASGLERSNHLDRLIGLER